MGLTNSFDADDRICVACAGGDPFLQDRLDEDYFDDDREEDSDGERANACANCGECGPLYLISAIGDILDPVYRRIVSRNAEYPSWIEPGRKSPEEVIQDILEPDDSRISSALAEYLSQKEGYDVIHDGAEAMYLKTTPNTTLSRLSSLRSMRSAGRDLKTRSNIVAAFFSTRKDSFSTRFSGPS